MRINNLVPFPTVLFFHHFLSNGPFHLSAHLLPHHYSLLSVFFPRTVLKTSSHFKSCCCTPSKGRVLIYVCIVWRPNRTTTNTESRSKRKQQDLLKGDSNSFYLCGVGLAVAWSFCFRRRSSNCKTLLVHPWHRHTHTSCHAHECCILNTFIYNVLWYAIISPFSFIIMYEEKTLCYTFTAQQHTKET